LGLRGVSEPKVVSPVPWCPNLPGIPEYYTSFRSIAPSRCDEDVEVLHPRLLVGPAFSLRSLEAMTYYGAIRRSVSRLRRNFPFDLIHAHFGYPDGAVGAILARKYGVPLVITEQVPWLDEEGAVSSLQARWAVQQSSTVVAISRSVKRSIEDSIERF